MTRLGPRGLAALALLSSATLAAAEDPPLAPGRDPGGTAVAVIADGFDYRRSDLARVLARDGEGEAIAWDAVDGDRRPFAPAGSGTDIARAAAAKGGVRIVPIRADPNDLAALARAIAFAAATPARLVLVPLAAGSRDGLAVLRAAAQRFQRLLLVGAAPDLAEAERREADTAANLALIDSRVHPLAAAEAVAAAFACPGKSEHADAARLKQRLLQPSPCRQ